MNSDTFDLLVFFEMCFFITDIETKCTNHVQHSYLHIYCDQSLLYSLVILWRRLCFGSNLLSQIYLSGGCMVQFADRCI